MTVEHITETGRVLTAPSEEALERGWDFYNNPKRSKSHFVEYCKKHGIELMESTDDPYYKSGEKLASDWAEVVAYTYATHGNT